MLRERRVEMPETERIVLRGDLDDVFEELKALHLPTDIALATYLKNVYGDSMMLGMLDEDWLMEARELLDVLGLNASEKFGNIP